jgi:hypothetical protein
MEAIDLFDHLGVIELNFTEAGQTIGVLPDGVSDAIEVLRLNHKEREAVYLIEFCQKRLQECRITVVMQMRVDQFRLGKSRGRQNDTE